MSPRRATLDVPAQTAEFLRTLEAAASPERARHEKAYLKSELDFLGVSLLVFRRVAKDFHTAHPDLDRLELCRLVRALWRTRSHDLRAVGVALLDRYRRALTPGDLEFLEELIRASKTWAFVDWIATSIAADLIRRHPSLLRQVRHWARDPDFWVRRTALLVLLGDLRAGKGDFALFARLATPMLEEREFFIRKAIGWVLREVSKKRPELVYGFLDDHVDRVSGLTLREGSKYLPENQRASLKARFERRAPRPLQRRVRRTRPTGGKDRPEPR